MYNCLRSEDESLYFIKSYWLGSGFNKSMIMLYVSYQQYIKVGKYGNKHNIHTFF